MRFEAILLDGQKVTISVPGKLGEQSHILEKSRSNRPSCSTNADAYYAPGPSDHRYLFPRSDFDGGSPIYTRPAFPGRLADMRPPGPVLESLNGSPIPL